MKEFANQTALITGASEGIGRATAKLFAERGANLILVARNESRLQDLKSELSSYGVNISIFKVDIADTKAVDEFFKQAPPFDYAVNNAGTEGKISEVQELTLDDYSEVFDLNVRGLWLCMQNEVSHFRKNKKPGAIVNLSSILGFMGAAGSSLYGGSKHAVIGFTKSVAVEQINHGVRVNCVSPGAIDTAMIRRVLNKPEDHQFKNLEPLSRVAPAEEVAEAIVWLASSASKHINGHNLVIDAGRTVNIG
jgi:NAD(P)-dependent dehydrogenase (short-subunit alcohol dehydrogenase family)